VLEYLNIDCYAVDEEDAQDNNMEAEPSGSDREEAEQDDIEQHAPGGRRTGANASSAAANGYKREAEDNADPDVILSTPLPYALYALHTCPDHVMCCSAVVCFRGQL